jgi:hypothetical protein
VFATHTSLLPSPTHRFQVYFELRAAHDRAGAGVKHSTHVVRGPTRPSPDSTRGGIEVHRVLRVSTSLSTTSNTRHGQTLHNNTLGAAFNGATALHGINRWAETVFALTL